MALHPPNLDNRSFAELVTEARDQIRLSCPDWNDLTPGDPGMALVEVFAHLTETMIYRLNRLPEKAYVEFLRLIGVRLQPPCAAGVFLQFNAAAPLSRPVEIPRGTRVTVSRAGAGGEPPVFVTSKSVQIKPDGDPPKVMAYHLEYIAAELAGKGTGRPAQSVKAQRAPLVARLNNELDLVVGVESTPEEIKDRARALLHDGKTFRVWREVEDFADLGDDRFAYLVDRMTGAVSFAPAVRKLESNGLLTETPAVLAEIPGAGREIRLWYGRGGGTTGNLPAKTLDTWRDPIPQARLSVEQLGPASGGRDAETLENALVRGPMELHSLKRAVTARDYEIEARRQSGAIERAKAFTRAELWAHATPGAVEVLLVPKVPDGQRGSGPVTATMLIELQTKGVRDQIQQALDERRTLGTTCVVTWVKYKTVRVQAKVVVHREEDPEAVKQRVMTRLNETISPLTTKRHPLGWRLGQTLRDSHVYDILLSEPGVSYAENVDFFVDDVPEKNVTSIASDYFQRRTWYAAAGDVLYRTLNDGDGWEMVARFPGEEIGVIVTHPWRPGILAVATRIAGEQPRSSIYASWDCGETWKQLRETNFRIEDAAWALREGLPLLFLATDAGLFEILLRPGEEPNAVQVVFDKDDRTRGLYAVTTSLDINNQLNVAVAAQGGRGVYLSSDGGRVDSFRPIGLSGEDVRVLAVQYDGPKSFLWAGMAAAGPTDEGKGCCSWELLGSRDSVEKWRPFSKEWTGGSCKGLAFLGTRVLAATHRKGVLTIEARKDAAWIAPDFFNSGLPGRDHGRLQPVDALATAPEGRFIMAGGVEGVHRRGEGESRYVKCSDRKVESVTLPETWLFCSGEHKISVEPEDAKTRY